MDNWISVKDRLPELGEQVLIYEKWSGSDNYMMAVVPYQGRSNRRYHYAWPDGQDEQPGGYSPTHWMPLPTPPKPTNNEKE